MWRSKCPRRTKSRLNHECDRVDRRFSHSHCFGRDGRPTSPKMQFGKHRLRGASVLHRYAAPRSLPCFIPTLLGHHSSRGSRPDTETLHTQPLLADGARRSLAAAPLPRHLHHTHRPPPTPDEPAARAADRRRRSPSTRARARTSSVLKFPRSLRRLAPPLFRTGSLTRPLRPNRACDRKRRLHRHLKEAEVLPPARPSVPPHIACLTCSERLRRGDLLTPCSTTISFATLRAVRCQGAARTQPTRATTAERSQLHCVPSSSGAGLPVNRRPLRVPAQSSDRAVTRGHARLPCRDDGLPLAAPSAHVQSPKCAHSRLSRHMTSALRSLSVL